MGEVWRRGGGDRGAGDAVESGRGGGANEVEDVGPEEEGDGSAVPVQLVIVDTVVMGVPWKTTPEILESTIHTVRNCATALRHVVSDNFSPGSTARSERKNLVLVEIERIASMLETVILEADGQVGVLKVETRHEEHEESNDDALVDPDDVIPFNYDPEVDGPAYKTKWEHLEEFGVEYYDSDDSRKFYRPRN